MRRFFADNINDGTVRVTGTDVLHIRDVLRMKEGDSLLLCIDGTDYAADIQSISREEIVCRVFRESDNLAEPAISVTLYQGLPKGDKMELIIQKCVELGVNRIVPVQCERSVVRLAGDNVAKKLARWQRQAEEASKQCGRGMVAQIAEPVSVKNIADDSELKLLFWEKESQMRLKAALQDNIGSVSIFVGPEGGITDAEAELLTENGFISVTLGKRILRTETAGLAAVSAIMYRYDELG